MRIGPSDADADSEEGGMMICVGGVESADRVCGVDEVESLQRKRMDSCSKAVAKRANPGTTGSHSKLKSGVITFPSLSRSSASAIESTAKIRRVRCLGKYYSAALLVAPS